MNTDFVRMEDAIQKTKKKDKINNLQHFVLLKSLSDCSKIKGSQIHFFFGGGGEYIFKIIVYAKQKFYLIFL